MAAMGTNDGFGHDLIVVGASAGGVEALTHLASRLPEDLPASVLAVLHTAPAAFGYLDVILDKAGQRPERPRPIHAGRALRFG